ncbi:MAG: phage tail spike protein [Aristaeellaceae bacterium]
MSKFPRLLDSSFQEAAWLRPSSLSLTLALTPPCTATMTLPDGEPPVSMRQWVELYGPDGKSAGIYRVSSVSTAYGDEQRVQLEHGIATLEDTLVLLGKDAQGVDIREISGTMQDILTIIISQQTTKLWKLGAVDVPGDKTYTVAAGFSSALHALVDAVKQVIGYALTFDQTTTPWTVSLKALPSGVACECRMRRNMAGVTVSMDDSDMCTRAYSGALENGYMDADTVSTWGVVGKQLNIDDTADPSEAETFAQNYLEQHKNPTMTVEVDALRLVEITGEPLDAFQLGALCRVALPDWSVSMDERIISMTYSDLMAEPESVRLTLSNPGRDTSSRLAGIQQEVRRSGGRSAGGIARAMAYITEVDGELTLADQRISLLATDMNQASIRMNGLDASITAQGVVLDDLGERVSSAEIIIDGVNAELLLKAEKTEVNALTGEMETLETNVTVSADGLRTIIQQGDKTIAELKATIDGLENLVTDADGNVSELTNTVRGLESTVSTVDGRIVTLTNTADGLTSTITEQGVELSSFKTRIDEISATVQDTNGNVGSLVTKSDSVTAKVTSVDNSVSQLAVTADGMVYTLTKQGEELSSLKALIDEISLTVQDTNGAMGQLAVKSDSITAKVGNVNDKMNTITGSALWQTRDSITAVVGKMTVGSDGNLYINEGSGLRISKNGTSYGIYDEDSLTAGLLVQKINGSTSAKIKADVIELDGKTIANVLNGQIVNFDEADVTDLWATNATVKNLNADTGTFGTVDCDTIILGGNNVKSSTLSNIVTVGSKCLKVTGKAITFKNSSGEDETLYVVTSVGLSTEGAKSITYMHT